MILWKIDGQKEDDATTKTQLSLVSVWKVDEFQSKLGLPKHDIDVERGVVFVVYEPRQTQTSMDWLHFFGPISEMIHLGKLYGLFKGVLSSRFVRAKEIDEESS